MTSPGQRAPGIVGDYEDVRKIKPRDFERITDMNDAYVEHLVEAARARRRAFGGVRDRDGLGAIDGEHSSYATAFREFYRGEGMPVDEDAVERAWRKVQSRAVEEYLEAPDERLVVRESLSSKDTPMPEPPAPPQDEEEREVSESVPPSGIMESAMWQEWDEKVPSEDEHLYVEYYAAFAVELRKVLGSLSDQEGVRAGEVERLKQIFFEHLFKMYMNDYPKEKGTSKEMEYMEDLSHSDWFNDRWNEVLKAAQKS